MQRPEGAARDGQCVRPNLKVRPHVSSSAAPGPAFAAEPAGAPASRPARRRAAWALALALALGGVAPAAWAQATGAGPAAAHAEPIELASLKGQRSDEGVIVSFAVRMSLPREVEDALLKGVPLYFVAEARLVRQRWYWTDKRIAGASRTWRVAWQPLTRTWRVSFGGLQQRFDGLPEALSAISRVSSWKIAEPLGADDDRPYSIDFSYRLDSSQLPRPLQISPGGNSEWNMGVERSIALPDAGR